MVPKIAFFMVTVFLTGIVGCDRSPADISFKVSDSSFHCQGETCSIDFFLENQSPASVSVEYNVKLTSEREEILLEFEGETGVPALQKIKISKTMTVTGQPARLGVTVGNIRWL